MEGKTSECGGGVTSHTHVIPPTGTCIIPNVFTWNTSTQILWTKTHTSTQNLHLSPIQCFSISTSLGLILFHNEKKIKNNIHTLFPEAPDPKTKLHRRWKKKPNNNQIIMWNHYTCLVKTWFRGSFAILHSVSMQIGGLCFCDGTERQEGGLCYVLTLTNTHAHTHTQTNKQRYIWYILLIGQPYKTKSTHTNTLGSPHVSQSQSNCLFSQSIHVNDSAL